jgi:hypothetical protein
MKKNLKNLFNQAADNYYLKNTAKTYDQLIIYMSYERTNWADGLTGKEWEDEAECKMCAEEAATQAIEREMEEAE